MAITIIPESITPTTVFLAGKAFSTITGIDDTNTTVLNTLNAREKSNRLV
ncbi:hypothetical protein [Pseudoalteromonas 'SMAR']